MEKKIDIAAILKDCPRGMELDCVIYDGVTLDSVVFESEYHYENTNTYPIKITTKNGFSTRLTKYGQNVDIEEAKCVIFPKGKTTWKGFHRPFKDGDIIADDHGNIAIYKGTMWYNKKLANYYCGYRKLDNKFLIKTEKDRHFGLIEELHYASKEEKQKLFDVIEENDYEWDVENKALVKLAEQKFHKGDWVTDGVSKCQICFVDDTQYWYSENCILGSIKSVDKRYHLWTIQDAKDGDVLAINWYEGYDSWEKIIIFKKYHNEGVKGLINSPCIEGYGNTFKNRKLALYDEVPYFSKTWTTSLQPASKEQRDFLFQKIKEAGYKWNEKTKTLEELIKPTFKAGNKIKHKENAEWVCTIERVTEDRYYVDGHPTSFTILFSEQDKYELVPNKFDINTLKTFDQVLVRLTNNCVWMPKFFYYYDTSPKVKYYPFVTTDNIGYPQCIPYNGNEHLCRTTNDCDEFYRVWKE